MSNAKARAKKNGLEFNLTPEYLHSIIPNLCPVLGIPLDLTTDQSKADIGHRATIDRIDNNKGYVEGNVVIVSHRANRIKGDASLKELKCLVEYYERVS